jgi:heptosyltransferase II
MAILIKAIGLLLSLLPLVALGVITEYLSKLYMIVPSGRRRVLLSNIRYAFPEWTPREVRNFAMVSTARMFEMGLFSLCYIYFSKSQRRRSVLYSKETEDELKKLRKTKKPVLILLPHVCLFETMATSPFFRPSYPKTLGAIYRPNRNPEIDSRIQKSRDTVGIKGFSRKEALWGAKKHLSSGNWLVVLFDQNAGKQGALSSFLGRVASISTLPDLLCKSTKAITIYACPKRIGFFQTEIELTRINDSNSISLDSHKALAYDLTTNLHFSPEWLWIHGKWKTNFYPGSKFNFTAKRNLLPSDIPRKLTFVIRMPNWLGDVVMALPTLVAIRNTRKDVRLVLLCKPQFKDLLERFKVGEEILCLGNVFSISGMMKFLGMRNSYPECHFLFTNSFKGDLEAFLVGAVHRFGSTHIRKKRPLLTHCFHPPLKLTAESAFIHQANLWEEMARYFGLKGGADFSPLLKSDRIEGLRIGIILGSENNPLKRWELDKWLELCSLFLNSDPNLNINLYGTNKEVSVAGEISDKINSQRVFNLTGKTSLVELVDEFLTCKMVIGCDSGGVHLANSIGVKTVVLFGPTNPLLTRPCFDSPLLVIQPHKPSSSGGLPMSLLSVNKVFEKCKPFLHEN